MMSGMEKTCSRGSRIDYTLPPLIFIRELSFDFISTLYSNRNSSEKYVTEFTSVRKSVAKDYNEDWKNNSSDNDVNIYVNEIDGQLKRLKNLSVLSERSRFYSPNRKFKRHFPRLKDGTTAKQSEFGAEQFRSKFEEMVIIESLSAADATKKKVNYSDPHRTTNVNHWPSIIQSKYKGNHKIQSHSHKSDTKYDNDNDNPAFISDLVVRKAVINPDKNESKNHYYYSERNNQNGNHSTIEYTSLLTNFPRITDTDMFGVEIGLPPPPPSPVACI